LWFGLGDCDTAERVDVDWPSGITTVMEAVPAGEPVRIAEPARIIEGN